MQGDLFGAEGPRQRLAIEHKAHLAQEAGQKGKDTKARKRVAQTSRDAHETIKPSKREIVKRCLRVIPFVAPGMTADECASTLDLSVLSIRPRFTEMRDDGLIIRLVIDGKAVRRKNASGSTAYAFVRAAPE